MPKPSRKINFLATPLLVILGRAGGFLAPLLMAYFYKAGQDSDAFFFSFWIIFFFGGIATHLLEAVLLPYLSEEIEKNGTPYPFAYKVCARVLLAYGGCFLAVFFFLWNFLHVWTGRDAVFSKQVAMLFLEMSPIMILGVVTATIHALLYLQKNFWLPALTPLIRSLVFIGFLVFLHRAWGIHAAALGFGLGEVVRLVFLLWFFMKKQPKKHSAPASPQTGAFFHAAFFQVLALAATGLIPLTDHWFAAFLEEGKLSLLTYADRLVLIPNQIVLMGFVHILHTSWSEMYYGSDRAKFWTELRKDIRRAGTAAFIFSLIAWLLRSPIVTVLYGFSGLKPGELKEISDVFGWLILGFFPGFMTLLFSRVLFVMKKSVFCTVYSWAQVLINVLLNLVLMRIYGLQGIAISTFAMYAITAVYLFLYLRKPLTAEAGNV